MQSEPPLELDWLKMLEGQREGTAEVQKRDTSEVVPMKGRGADDLFQSK